MIHFLSEKGNIIAFVTIRNASALLTDNARERVGKIHVQKTEQTLVRQHPCSPIPPLNSFSCLLARLGFWNECQKSFLNANPRKRIVRDEWATGS